eukprot:scaffold270_cov121-Isochrysis_galbana.AAC.10
MGLHAESHTGHRESSQVACHERTIGGKPRALGKPQLGATPEQCHARQPLQLTCINCLAAGDGGAESTGSLTYKLTCMHAPAN